MALPQPKTHELKQYLKRGFSLKEDWESEQFHQTYSYNDIKANLKLLSVTDPELHKLLGWVWLSNRSRSQVAEALYMDPSTLKRKQDKAMYILLNYLNNIEVAPTLDAIDLLQQL